MNKNFTLSFFAGILFFITSSPSFAASEGLKSTLNVLRCTTQWDQMIYAEEYRQQGMPQEEARKTLFSSWMRPEDKEEYKSMVSDAINSAVDHVYSTNPKPEKFSAVLNNTHKGFIKCVKSRNLVRFEKELKTASLKAGLVTLWDNYRRKGIRKEQILAKSKKMTASQKKLLDEVYEPNFGVKHYRLKKIWNPTTAYISQKYFGVKVNL